MLTYETFFKTPEGYEFHTPETLQSAMRYCEENYCEARLYSCDKKLRYSIKRFIRYNKSMKVFIHYHTNEK
jgi:hypothetical protein